MKLLREGGIWKIIHPQATVETEDMTHAFRIVEFMLGRAPAPVAVTR